ncbi:MAG TPA: VIT domain-containing protein, partial [Gemmata sp.]
YHHVTVDIRDQISRTTIEESFVNATPDTLEGVFHFPLPQDASISGFGMWIGDQLVEADVVEKQRAREIYEGILRQKRDPGLLEWAGGNIFKARVFPIPGRAEKRIKITYTQVLPLQGNRYRYSYALQSELLKRHPLRELKIDVKVNSAVALKSVASPTHPARIARTAHSGHVEFAAQEYTPARDFEAVFEVEPGRPDLVVVPHRRGDDGYFMVQLTPPGAAAAWERPLVPNGSPLKLLVVADTSASMDKAQRANQTAVLSALLGALTPKDTLNLAACDVNCDWVFEKPVPATPANVTTAQQFLAKRSPLGWTDLDKAFASVLKMTEPGTHVVYLGDAVPTTGNADPVAFAKRLQRLYESKSGTFHAVALGSSYEPAALNAIGSLGGGSVRRVSSSRNPQATALDLLTEIAAPALRDLKVEFTGLRTARVYPEVLPNVPAGTQQILLGRYLPESKDQSGEIVVTGTLGGKPVRYAAKIQLRGAEQGNSFVPRLWARMHLDKLLEQGRTEGTKQDVIALSEEFHIITPYTSLLVLESDADRARFAVKRRFQMRDGERFFADGREAATFALKQHQMELAGDYRTALRRNVLAQLNGLGRNAALFRFRPREIDQLSLSDTTEFDGGYSFHPASATEITDPRPDWPPAPEPASLALPVIASPLPAPLEPKPEGFNPSSRREPEIYDTSGAPDPELLSGYGGEINEFDEKTLADLRSDGPGLPGDWDRGGLWERESRGRPRSKTALPGLQLRPPAAQPFYYRGRGPQLRWLGGLFPSLAPPAREPKEPKTLWPAPALALSRSLLRGEKLGQLQGGIVVARQSDHFTAARGELSARSHRLELIAPGAWLARNAPEGGPVTVSWCDPKECGTFSTAFQLGRVRASNKEDLTHPPLELQDASVTALHVTHAHLVPTVETVAKDRALLVMKYKYDPDSEARALIDTERRVLLSLETRNKNAVTSRTRFADFVEVGGRWWATRIETLDEKGRRVALATQTVTAVPADRFAGRLAQELAGKGKVLFLASPLPTVADAKKHVAEGKATFDDRAVLALHFAATQQWARALEHFQEAETLAAGKAGLKWLRDSFLLASRRHDELRTRLIAGAAALVETQDTDARANDFFLAEHLAGSAAGVLQTNERLALDDALRKVYERQPAHVGAVKAWRARRVALVEQSGQVDKALALAKELATDYPRDHTLQYSYAQSLAISGDYAAAFAWLDRVLVPAAEWDRPDHETSLRELYANLLRQQGRFRELVVHLAEWMKAKPDSVVPFAQYLGALVRSNQSAKAEELAAEWMREALVPGELAPAVSGRLHAAVNFALGSGYDLYTNRVEGRWYAPLLEVARFFSRRDDQMTLVSHILSSSRFSSTDVARAARKEIADALVREIATLPVARIDYLMTWVWAHDGTEQAAWKAIAAALRKRWDAERDPYTKNQIAHPLTRVLSWLGEDEWLTFLRVQLQNGPELYRADYANQLFDALLERPWTAAGEDELFALLDKLAAPDAPANGLYNRVAALHRLTDTLLEARFQARMKTVERPDTLTRTELQKKHEENRKLAREGFADRLHKEAAKHPQPFANWIVAERVWLDVRLERNLKAAAEDCWALLSAPVVKADPANALAAWLDEVLRDRALAVLQNLAARKGADADLIGRLVRHVDGHAQQSPDSVRWRAEKYQLLIALDRPKQLEADLARWTSEPFADARWRLALGYLLAEQGKVPEAIKQFELVRAADELPPSAYRSLAAWYLVENRRAEHEKAQAAIYQATDEYQLSGWLNNKLRPWRSSSGPL